MNMVQVPELVKKLRRHVEDQHNHKNELINQFKDDEGYNNTVKAKNTKEEEADRIFKSCKCNGQDSKGVKPIFLFIITYKSSPGWRTEAYQFGLLTWRTEFVLRTFTPDGKYTTLA